MGDVKVEELIQRERETQLNSIDLIASENYTSLAVRRALASTFSNKYAEGVPGCRLYPGMSSCDELENLCISRLRAVFCVPEDYFVTVEPLSGGPANLALITFVLGQAGRILMMDERDGGHFTHGGEGHILRKLYQYEHYRAHATTGVFDFQELSVKVAIFKPDLVIIGASEVVNDYDYRIIKEIVGSAHLHVDMSHLAGLIAGGQLSSPFPYADSVVSTTHKTLRGPRGGIIISKKDAFPALFPGFEAGPHMATVAALAVSLFEAQEPEFKKYASEVVENARAMARVFKARKYSLVGDGTDTHMIIVEVGDGEKAERLLGGHGIFVNACHFCGSDRGKSAVRIGSPMLTTLGLKQDDFEMIANLVLDIIEGKNDDFSVRKAFICAKYEPDDADDRM